MKSQSVQDRAPSSGATHDRQQHACFTPGVGTEAQLNASGLISESVACWGVLGASYYKSDTRVHPVNFPGYRRLITAGRTAFDLSRRWRTCDAAPAWCAVVEQQWAGRGGRSVCQQPSCKCADMQTFAQPQIHTPCAAGARFAVRAGELKSDVRLWGSSGYGTVVSHQPSTQQSGGALCSATWLGMHGLPHAWGCSQEPAHSN